MRGEYPANLYRVAYELKMTVEAVEAMDPDERLGWEAFFTVKPVLDKLAADTMAARVTS